MAVVKVNPPLAGITRKLGYQAQAPFSSYSSLNFLPFDAVSGRSMAATRPARTALGEALDGKEVNMLCRVNGDKDTTPQESMVAAAEGVVYRWNGADWVAITGDNLPTVDEDRPVYAAPFLKKVFIFQEDTAPLVFDYSARTLTTASANSGTFPTNCRFGVTWKNCLWLGGDPANPHVFQCSANGDPFDWDFSDLSDGGAYISTTEDSGLIGQPLTAFIPLTADSMAICGAETIFILRRHPRRGGSLECASTNIGVLNHGAWSYDGAGNVYFLSRMGLCMLDRNGNVSRISKEKIPDELLNIESEYTNPTVSMAFDSRWNGIVICVRGSDNQAWWFDLELGGFHRMTFSHYPYVMMRFDPIEAEGQSAVVFGGAGYGGTSRFDTTGSEDFLFYLLAGPVKIANSLREKSMVSFAQHVFSGNTTRTADCGVRIWAGATPEDVVARYLADDQTGCYAVDVATSLRNGGRCYPRLVGNSVLIELSGSGAGNRMVYDGSELHVASAGTNKSIPMVTGDTSDPFANLTAQVLTASQWKEWANTTIPFNPRRWSTVATATMPQPASNISGFTHILDMSELPVQFWQDVQESGDDIRVLVNNAPVPFDLLPGTFDKFNREGTLLFKADVGPSHGQTVQIYGGNPEAHLTANDKTVLQYNAYGSSVAAFYPTGDGTDRTVHGRDLSTPRNIAGISYSAPTDGEAVFGITSSKYAHSTDGGGDVTTPALISGELSDAVSAISVLAVVKVASAGGVNGLWSVAGAGGTTSLASDGFQSPPTILGASDDQFSTATDIWVPGTTLYSLEGETDYLEPQLPAENLADASVEMVSGQWVAVGLSAASTLINGAYVFAGGVAAPPASQPPESDYPLNRLGRIVIGNGLDGSVDIAMVMVATEVVSSAYIARHAAQVDQSTFYGTWSIERTTGGV